MEDCSLSSKEYVNSMESVPYILLSMYIVHSVERVLFFCLFLHTLLSMEYVNYMESVLYHL